MDFNSFGLDARLLKSLRALGYETPTPIQERTIPICLSGKDVMGLAQTGTGKTAAFGLPIIERIIKGQRKKLRALVLVPTRELADQVYQSIKDLGGETRPHVAAIYGGVSMGPQMEHLRRGAEIVVACPGRLLDHVEQRTIDLSHIEVLVLDEADRMFDMGFIGDVRRIAKLTDRRRQTLLFSATMPNEIAKLAKEVLNHPERVEVSNTRPVETVSHALYEVDQHLKTKLLERILHHTDTESILIFTRTKHRAERLAKHLRRLGQDVASLQGNLSQNRRKAAMDGFRSGKFKILVATDIAARGIDISTISHVINYDIPDTAEAYTHRIGRTGRAARTGDALTLVTREDREIVHEIEKTLGTKIERKWIDGFDYKESKAEVKREEKKFERRAGDPGDGRELLGIGPHGEGRRNDRPRQGPRGERPRGDRPRSGGHPTHRREDAPHRVRREGAPAASAHAEHAPRTDAERPNADRPHSDRPTTGRPHGDRAPTHRPQGDRPRSDRPHSDRPRSNDGAPRGDRRPSSGDRRPASGERSSSFGGDRRSGPSQGGRPGARTHSGSKRSNPGRGQRHGDLPHGGSTRSAQ